jgi:hypothetical protein
MRAKLLVAAVTGWALAWTAHAGAQPPTQPPGGCPEFGQNVAGLAQGLGGDFGAAASAAARLEPGGIVTFVVAPEQAGLCP